MEGTYEVCLDCCPVGTVSVTRRGLYYEILGRCTVSAKQMLHLILETGTHTEDLGLMIPATGGLELKRQIPSRRIGEGKACFFLRPRNAAPEDFVPVKPEDPFLYLHLLQSATLAFRGENIGICIRKKTTEKG